MKKISAEIVADSISPQGHRITTFLLTYPRFIHAELMTHRMFSRNSASSRAIPFEKMVKMVEEDSFVPIAWQKDHKGMQGVEYITNPDIIKMCEYQWLQGKECAVKQAACLNTISVNNYGVSKQICNRLLEPFMWHTVLVTATEWDNFYELRCPKYVNEHENGEDISYSRKDFISKLKKRYPTNWESDLRDFHGIENDEDWEWARLSKSGAEIHIQALAEAMWDAMNESTPKELKEREWHIPFGDKLLITDISDIIHKVPYKEELNTFEKRFPVLLEEANLAKIKIATARCARLSYMTFDGEIDYEKDIKLHDQLLENKHASPMEHCARVMNEYEFHNFTKGFPAKDGIGSFVQTGWCNNFRGFIPYRYLVENE